MDHIKLANTDYPIEPKLANRWSPYAFADRDVADTDLRSLFEAARWAASSYNGQPWSYIVAKRTDADGFARALSCLTEGNQAWANAVPVLAFGCAHLNFEHNGEPNAAALHDLGQASANLTFEASARGLVVHQMIGIEPARVSELYELPADVRPLTALAIGYVGDSNELAESFRSRDLASRKRKSLDAFVFGYPWGKPAQILD